MDKLVFENEKCKFYENDMTRMMTKYCTEENAHKLFPLENYRVFLVEEDNRKLYLLCDMTNPVYACTSAEAMGAHIDMLRLKLTSNTLADTLAKIKEAK